MNINRMDDNQTRGKKITAPNCKSNFSVNTYFNRAENTKCGMQKTFLPIVRIGGNKNSEEAKKYYLLSYF